MAGSRRGAVQDMVENATAHRLVWRQLPIILVAGLLVGAVFGLAITAFVPAPTVIAAKSKARR
jgi:hypothetical protein